MYLLNNTEHFLRVTCKDITKLFSKTLFGINCKMNLLLENINHFKITAGQINIQEAVFGVELYDHTTEDLLAILHVNLTMWVSFGIEQKFIVHDIDLGERIKDYNITAWSTNSTIGNVSSDLLIRGFETAVNKILTPTFKLDLYENWFSENPKLMYLSP